MTAQAKRPAWSSPIERDRDMSSDELERVEKELDKLTQEMVAAIDKLLAHKEQELLEI